MLSEHADEPLTDEPEPPMGFGFWLAVTGLLALLVFLLTYIPKEA